MSFTPLKTKITMEKQQFEDVSPRKNGANAILVLRGASDPSKVRVVPTHVCLLLCFAYS